jgi:hypothetical protein
MILCILFLKIFRGVLVLHLFRHGTMIKGKFGGCWGVFGGFRELGGKLSSFVMQLSL